MITVHSEAQLYHSIAMVTLIVGGISEGRGEVQCFVNINIVHMLIRE